MVGNGLYSYFLNPLLLLILTVYVRAQTISITQHPGNDTFCEGSNAVLSCVVFDNSTNDAANTTGWFTDDNPPVRVPDTMLSNTRDGDMVTSVLTIESVSLNDNGTGYFCLPSVRVESYVGMISVAATPPAITAIEVTEVCTNDCTVSWTAASNEEGVSYNVTLSPSVMGSVIFNPVMNTSYIFPVMGTSYNFTGLTPDIEYVVSVSSRINNCSGILNTTNVTTFTVEAGMPQGVNNLRDVMVTANAIRVMWNDAVSPSGCGAVFYTATVVKLTEPDIVITMVTSDNVTEFTDLINGTSYNISVAAVNRVGIGPSSMIIVNTSTDNEVSTTDVIPTPSPTPGDGGSPTPTTGGESGDDNTVIIIVIILVIIVLIIITIITILVGYRIKKGRWPCMSKDSKHGDTQELKSPTSTVAKVQPSSVVSSVTHQTAASGEEYAVASKIVPRQQQQPAQEYAIVDKSKKHSATTQGITYADLQELPSSGNVPPQNQGPTSTYAMVA